MNDIQKKIADYLRFPGIGAFTLRCFVGMIEQAQSRDAAGDSVGRKQIVRDIWALPLRVAAIRRAIKLAGL